MSSFNRRAFLIAAAATAAGCGFTPAYGPGGGASVLQGRVEVDEPNTRDGYLLVRQLENRLGRAQTPRFGLSVALDTSEEGLAYTQDAKITRYDLIGKATYALRDLGTGEVLTSGTVDSFTGYSTTGSTVATLAAESDARERLMIILADQITTHLLAAAQDLPQ